MGLPRGWWGTWFDSWSIGITLCVPDAPVLQAHKQDRHPKIRPVTYSPTGDRYRTIDLTVAQEFAEEHGHEVRHRLHAHATLHSKDGGNSGRSQLRPQGDEGTARTRIDSIAVSGALTRRQDNQPGPLPQFLQPGD